MKLKTLIVTTFICSGFLVRPSVAQTSQLGSASVSLDFGGFVSSRSGFSDTYGSNLGLALGGGVGLPLTNHLYLCGKATYFSKSGTPWWYTYGYQNGVWTIISKTREGSATFTQWIINGGLQYDFLLSKVYSLGVDGGVTYTNFSEKVESANGLGSSNESGRGILGFYGGVSGERSFEESPFAIFVDAQYNNARLDVASAIGNYGGINLSVGVRYYFGQRSKE